MISPATNRKQCRPAADCAGGRHTQAIQLGTPPSSTPPETASNSLVAAAAAEPELRGAAAALSHRLGIPLYESLASPCSFLLVRTRHRLELHECGSKTLGPIFADFIGGTVGHRRRYGGGRGQPLARAVGLKHGHAPTVLDATAGLGRDAVVLANLGCRVTLIERSPIVAALLEDGLERARADPNVSPATSRMDLIGGEAATIMASLNEEQRPEVVYLDPMYPHRHKSALVKKEMRMLRPVVGDDADAPALLASALACARKRVVVKRPRRGVAIDGPPPTVAIFGKNTRFDIYVIAAFPGR